MNIAVFGWYHHRNAGDDRIQACITRWLDGHTLAFLPAGRPPSLPMLKTYDAAIIGGGGIVNTRGGVFRNMARWAKAAGVPVVLLGVSIERLSEALRSELREFLDLDVCAFAWFRDQGSHDELGPHPKAFVAPDLTWLYPMPLLPDAPSDCVALCLRKYSGLDVEAWKRVVDRLDSPVLPWPLYFEQGGDAEPLRRVLPGADVPDDFSLGPLEAARAAVSMRYHGVLFALQAGRPATAVGNQPKLTRFMAEQRLVDWHLTEAALDRVPDVLRALNARRADARSQVLEVRDRLATAAAQAADVSLDQLLTAADQAARNRPRWTRTVRAFISPGSRS